jgi:hypothetical protein
MPNLRVDSSAIRRIFPRTWMGVEYKASYSLPSMSIFDRSTRTMQWSANTRSSIFVGTTVTPVLGVDFIPLMSTLAKGRSVFPRMQFRSIAECKIQASDPRQTVVFPRLRAAAGK